MIVSMDGKPYFHIILRQGPQYDGIHFAQTFHFNQLVYEMQKQRTSSYKPPSSYITPKFRQLYETSSVPQGLLFQFIFSSNHGDDYYIGVDRIEFIDEENKIIEVLQSGAIVTALPYSVQDLASSKLDPLFKDPRIPESLFLPLNQSDTGFNSGICWLAPLARCMTPVERESTVSRVLETMPKLAQADYGKRRSGSFLPQENILFVQFNYPVRLGAVRIWNYSKNPHRGARDFSLLVDGKYVFMGALLRSDE